jgi:hypothetical protein
VVSKFDETLPIITGRPRKGTRLGLCAMGPVADGDKLTFMRVWIWQQDGAKVAASTGTSGTHIGGPKEVPREKPPFVPKRGWMVQTELEPGSKQFSTGKPALAMALAMVKRPDGSTDVEHWSQAVVVRGLDDDDYEPAG